MVCDHRWHEVGCKDLPAMIDYVLQNTNRTNLIYAGHSQGTTSFWVMASELPEYQEKIKAMFALGPIAYLDHVKSLFYRIVAQFTNNIKVRCDESMNHRDKKVANVIRKLIL